MVTVEYVRLWLAKAISDAKVALLAADPDPVHALYMVQQSTEKACKALLFAAGKQYKEVRKFQHISLNVFLSFTETFVQIRWIQQSISDLVAPDIYMKIGQVMEQARNPNTEFWNELARWDKTVISKLLSVRKRYRRAREKMLELIQNSPSITFESSQPDVVSVIEEYVTTNFGHLTNKARIDFTSTLARALTDMVGIHRITKKGSRKGKITFTSEQITELVDGLFRFGELMADLYIISAITFTHEAYTRYPSAPNQDGKPSLGYEQYDASSGPIVMIRPLSQRALEISQEMHDNAEVMTAGIRILLEATRVEREREEQARRQAEVERDAEHQQG